MKRRRLSGDEVAVYLGRTREVGGAGGPFSRQVGLGEGWREVGGERGRGIPHFLPTVSETTAERFDCRGFKAKAGGRHHSKRFSGGGGRADALHRVVEPSGSQKSRRFTK